MINDSCRQYNEARITDEYSNSESNSLPDLDLLNLRGPCDVRGALNNETNPNSGKNRIRPCSANFQCSNLHSETSELRTSRKKFYLENLPGHSNQESIHFNRKGSPQLPKCTHTIRDHCVEERDRTFVQRSNITYKNVVEDVAVDKKNIHSHRTSPRERNRYFPSSKQYKATETDQENNRNFPFKQTPSGHLKIQPDQVIFSSKKIGILIADPTRTKVNIQNELGKIELTEIMPQIPRKFFQQPYNIEAGDSPKIPHGGTTTVPDNVDVPKFLTEEMKLEKLGYCNVGNIDYSSLVLPDKTNLYQELYRRITNYLNTDVKVIIGQEEFSCHSMVLQSYSDFFEKNNAHRKIELPQEEVTINAFIAIYEWMISGPDCVSLLKRNNILEVFRASRYLIIKELEEQCWAFLDSEDIFCEDTAFMLYVEAKQMKVASVKELMIPRIRNFFLMLVSSQDFVELDIEEVCVLLRSNYIAVHCEMEVLLSAVRWLKYDWENRLKNLVPIMSCVRFGLIAPWQLVDIKRNPENPEILEIMANPDVLKMMDDGLSFVIIKYWYGHDLETFRHWAELLGLTEPQERNWAGDEKNYVTYKQFLAFLEEYRRENVFHKNKVHSKKQYDANSVQVCYDATDRGSTPSLMGKHNIASKSSTSEQSNKCIDSDRSRSPISLSRSIEDEAATTIQSAYRAHKTRKHTRHSSDKKSPREKYAAPMKRASKYTDNRYSTGCSQNLKVLSLFATEKDNKEREFSRKIVPLMSNSVKDKYLAHGSLFSNDRETILVFGGIDPHYAYGIDRNTGKDIYGYSPEANCWEYVAELPEPRHHHSCVFFKGRVYLAGGTNPINDDVKENITVVNTVWSFDPITRVWYKEIPMITARKNFALIVNHMKMYAIGGQDINNRMLSSVERFQLGGKWEEVAPLKSPRMGMACAKYRDSIWVAGGMCGSRRNPLISTVECYDARKNEWISLENLRFPRCFANLFAMNDKLYLIGGAGRIAEKVNNTSSVGAVDVWDSLDKQWKLKTELSIPRHGHAVAYLGTQMFVIGGVSTIYMRALSNIECFCCERQSWVRGIASLPTTLSGHSCITLPPASLM